MPPVYDETRRPSGAMPSVLTAAGVRFFAMGVSAAWADATVGPVARIVSRNLHVSLASVGLLSGTVFFGAGVVATWVIPPLTRRLALTRALRVGFVLEVGGNALCTAAPSFGWLLGGRAVVGLGIGFVFVTGTALAREIGGTRLIGLFGGGAGLGVAGALGAGGLLPSHPDAWRAVFAVTGAVAVGGFALVPRHVEPRPLVARHFTLVVHSLTRPWTWRVLAAFIATNSVPLVLAIWLSAYLTSSGAIAPGLAGALGALLFVLQILVRPLGGRISASGRGRWVPAAGLAAAGMGIGLLAVGRWWLPALVAVAAIGAGFSLCYAAAVDAAAHVLPDAPSTALAHFQTWGNAVPMVVAPLIGVALKDHVGTLAFAAMGGAVFTVALASVRVLAPITKRAATGPSPGPGARSTRRRSNS